MMRVRAAMLTLVLLACVAALAPLTSSAALPKPKTALIVPFKSMDGVKLGVTQAKATSKWGPALCADEDSGGRTCSWFADSQSDFPAESASLQISPSGDVCGMLIRAGTNATTGKLTITGLKKWKTEEGVGVGSQLKAAKKVLGKLVVKKHGVTTAFFEGTTPESNDQVESIEIFDKGCTVT
jgi:hypothetical protein